jgi:geranylgeranyl diphosphate synthase type I
VNAHPTDRADLRDRVGKALEAFLAHQRARFDTISVDLSPVYDGLESFVMDGGKRLRAAFCYWGWRGAGGPDADEAVRAAAALEWLHACALVHDDVMDGSDTRRGRPSVHRRFEALHRRSSWTSEPAGFGRSAAILIGDLCLIWADEMLNTAGLPAEALLRALPCYDEMRTELMAGQYLDLLEQALGASSIPRSMTVARFKSAKYTIERPLHLGASLAGGGPDVLATYTAFGLPLGEAFQLRDDVLGVFGDPEETGKPAGDDLREGKRTVLVATALAHANRSQAAVLSRFLGDPELPADGVAALRQIIVDTGALADSEERIDRLTTAALATLSAGGLPGEATEVLHELAIASTTRQT